MKALPTSLLALLAAASIGCGDPPAPPDTDAGADPADAGISVVDGGPEMRLCDNPVTAEYCGFTQDLGVCPPLAPRELSGCGALAKHQCAYCYTVDGALVSETWVCGSRGWADSLFYVEEIEQAAEACR